MANQLITIESRIDFLFAGLSSSTGINIESTSRVVSQYFSKYSNTGITIEPGFVYVGVNLVKGVVPSPYIFPQYAEYEFCQIHPPRPAESEGNRSNPAKPGRFMFSSEQYPTTFKNEEELIEILEILFPDSILTNVAEYKKRIDAECKQKLEETVARKKNEATQLQYDTGIAFNMDDDLQPFFNWFHLEHYSLLEKIHTKDNKTTEFVQFTSGVKTKYRISCRTYTIIVQTHCGNLEMDRRCYITFTNRKTTQEEQKFYFETAKDLTSALISYINIILRST